uniref:CCR4-NOT transcription complex subunit 10 n=1 Tax=Coccolithus braarudii TaxID=221442 RepID=A0A7S0LQM2_9EUKA|mmetsp:Transcript_51424/g.109879  ORF Transcript_51424/g.109879 Transcript_51424/m.109879 type:complete len:709 (+) Transcript_51424:159-2285(+)|eukprot:CAMPEP_0183344916 /NCGR_PEP_ID=MMETSP0164_2-20130417/10484_1 /TAXON_ID=221442 /ORGANISM="Coccolithus pelagicus ssp braarudi, Strain PLY182g" /LENGTH=708 /DNA_ID=CAMNT_0025515997 /DNA_START=145 /DNA_END=2271 /DNA_ORIENTATION=-
MGHEAEEGAPELAVLAGSAYADGEIQAARSQLQKLLKQREGDPKVLHNAAITEYTVSGSREPRKLLSELEKLRLRVEEARAEAESGEGGTLIEVVGDADASLISYNTAVLLYQLKQYARCRSILEEMFSNIEPIDEFLAFKVCFLLLEVQLLQRQTDKASEVLAYLERSYSMLTKVEGIKENGASDGPTESVSAELKGGLAPSDWPNKRSARRPPTDVTPEEVRAALNVYKAKLSLLARSSKSSKREIKTTLNACAQNTTGLFLKSNLEYQRGNYRKAIKLLSNSCQKNDRDPNVAALYFNNMGCIHHCMRRHTAAGFYFSRALQENLALYTQKDDRGGISLPAFSCDRRCEMEYNRGLQLLLSGKPEQAYSSFQVALLLLHRQPRLWLRLGETCMAVHVQQEAQQRVQQEGRGTAKHVVVGQGKARHLVLPARTDRMVDPSPVAEEAAPPPAEAASSASAAADASPSLAYGIKCLRNSLLLCETQRTARSSAEYSVLVAANALGTLTLSEEYSLQLYTIQWLALLQLSWCCLVQEDYLQAHVWATQLLKQSACASTLKVFAHLYACDALCHLSRSAEAEGHIEAALQLGDSLAAIAGGGSASAANGSEASVQEGDIGCVRNPYTALSPGLELAGTSASRSVLYANLAAVHILQGDLEHATQCTQQALGLQPQQRSALLCLAYLELRNGNTEAALHIIKRQRLPAPID